jgi:RNA recognition motif-containing protein
MASNLFVGGLPYETTSDELRKIFSACGTVKNVKIIIERETGRSKGFGFVEMSTDAEAQDAIRKLNGTAVGQRTMFINEARPPEKRVPGAPPGPGGPRPGGFSPRPGGGPRPGGFGGAPGGFDKPSFGPDKRRSFGPDKKRGGKKKWDDKPEEGRGFKKKGKDDFDSGSRRGGFDPLDDLDGGGRGGGGGEWD